MQKLSQTEELARTLAAHARRKTLTPDQIKRLSGFTSQLTLLFDGDRAGRKAALRSCEMLLTRGLACTVVLMPEGEDIDSLLRAIESVAQANDK